MVYIAHINEKENKVQSVKEHCENTGNLCSEYCIPMLKPVLYNIGLLHDIGKYQPAFQKRISGKNISVEHSVPGAIVATTKYNNLLGLIIAACITGHHTGLPNLGNFNDSQDMSTLYGRLKRTFEDYSIWNKEIVLNEQVDDKLLLEKMFRECNNITLLSEKMAFWTRYCFSCLTDADSIDTANFCGTNYNIGLKSDFDDCLKKVDEKMASFNAITDLQKARKTIQQQVFDNKDYSANFYFMNMPTGSGKTLCSVKLALRLAKSLNKKRIIYIIPFNSIIDQTVDEFEKAFGASAEILRHQSSFSYDDIESEREEDYRRYARFSIENWNADFIVTTAVQFFESLASNKRSKLRKLHNMADSILIFDEAHMMPVNYLHPCLQAIKFVTEELNSIAVFLTATMPNYTEVYNKYLKTDIKAIDLVKDRSLFSVFKKCNYIYLGIQSEEAILTRACKTPSSLIIVNRRKVARNLYNLITGKKYHLSTYMTPFDRKRIIDEIKCELAILERDYPELKNVPENRRITVVSTSLIEAGVDLDFHTVFRELSGLDSILQAGGRCNREGRRKLAEVFVYISEQQKSKVEKDDRANIALGIINDFENIDSDDAVKCYYDRYFALKKQEINSCSIGNMATSPKTIPFEDYAKKFKLIDGRTVSIIVGQNEASRAIINAIKHGQGVDFRKSQKYACTVYRYELQELMEMGVVDDFETGVYCLTNSDYYDPNLGILFEGKDYYLEEGGFIL